MTSTTPVPQTYGYVSLGALQANVREAVTVGLIDYDRGYRKTRLGMESSKPEEMLEAARALGADDALIKNIRALIAADRLIKYRKGKLNAEVIDRFNPEEAQRTIDELALSPDEKQSAATILTNYLKKCMPKPSEYYSHVTTPLVELLSK